MHVYVQTVVGKKYALEIKEPSITASALRALVARETQLPADRLKLVLHGKSIPNDKTSQIRLIPGDTLLAVVAPQPPSEEMHAAQEQQRRGGYYGEEEEEEEPDPLRFRLAPTASPLQRRIAHTLQHTLHVPDLVLVVAFGIKPWVWVGLVVWLGGAHAATRWEVGSLYVLGTILAIIFINLGTRKPGEASAYSIFNDFQALPGQLTADEIDRQLRQGHM